MKLFEIIGMEICAVTQNVEDSFKLHHCLINFCCKLHGGLSTPPNVRRTKFWASWASCRNWVDRPAKFHSASDADPAGEGRRVGLASFGPNRWLEGQLLHPGTGSKGRRYTCTRAPYKCTWPARMWREVHVLSVSAEIAG